MECSTGAADTRHQVIEIVTPNNMVTQFGLLVPTLNAGTTWEAWIAALKCQTRQPALVLVLDSGSSDNTVEVAHAAGFSVLHINRSEFNHGGTRQIGLEHIKGTVDLLVLLTQDAILAQPDSLEQLLTAFDDPAVGTTFGRQLPATNAGPLAAHARAFNYPTTSRTIQISDREVLGFKVCFLSNSFAAYRVSDLVAVGGFPKHVILGEDTSVAAKMLLTGKSIRYQAGACAYHSHNYTAIEEFKRYFDTGVFHARSPWLLDSFGGAGGEGRRFVISEILFLLHTTPWLIPAAFLRTGLKFLGYRLGRAERFLPVKLKYKLSMFRNYWLTDTSRATSLRERL